MKKFTVIFLIVSMISPAAIFADRQEGILKQFRAVEEALRSRTKTPEARKETLENNLQRGLREAILRMFYEERKSWLDDLKPQNFGYENPTSPKVYYVKFKNLLIRFDFATNPELYYQAPVLRKVLIIDDATAHSVEGVSTPAAPANGADSN